MSSQRPGRHQRRASQSVFVLPDNFADLDDVPAAGAGSEDGRKAATTDAAGGQQARPPAARHRRAMSVAVASSRELEMIKEDMGSYKIGA
uniref:Uncharacterized protein n=1 Tax=Oryza punctata TaxID=4537 RepID=A0A0E0L3G7_ORYPU